LGKKSDNFVFLLKNGVDGGVKVILNAIDVVKPPGRFPKVSNQGQVEFIHALGSNNIGVVLRGGDGFTNYDIDHVTDAYYELSRLHPTRLVNDASHGNSGKSARVKNRLL
jgi:3-deoxy-7-phosphoheptulonate synthase